MTETRRATLKSFNSTTYKATIQVAGSLSTWLDNIPVSRAIPSAEMTAGRSVAVLFFDPANPDDAVVVAVWT